ncbi:hypothetical protein A9G22_04605 [Gilliamella sp. App2-1]|uniref:hypothetical protein n=1 Tax=Gilliamella sp. App2-1 TaxID=3120230 RepID=UPI000827FA6B|nr:hypothetical protein [Gilliamella apicola]OCG24399.1 hypothetical protein A9G22_04605 [Gilliamella apicola]
MNIIRGHFKTIIYAICLLHLTTSNAVLSTKTAHIVQGTKPKFSSAIEANISDFELFGLTVDDKNYYGNEISNMSIPISYSFKNRIKIAPLKQPNRDQYLDTDGDELAILDTKENPQLIWYYTNASNQLVEFTPKDNDTFCSLTQKGQLGPYKVKISADLTLSSKYGIPNSNEYPNEDIITHPSKIYTVLEDAGICYAKPELAPTQASASTKNQWNIKYGFLTQSNIDTNKNFPTTAFYGAQFDLLLAKNGLAKNYDWQIVKGNELITISNNADVVTVKFNTAQAANTKTAWQHVMESNNGYTVIIQGRNKVTGHTIQYPFTITKWFSDWDKNFIGQSKANRGSVQEVILGCETLNGNYRISHADELSNAPFGQSAGTAKFTREIGSLLGEWGDPNQKAYPNSWAAASNQALSFKRIWVYDTDAKEYCDLHPYNARYHCRSESEHKNGVCIAIK